MSIAITFKSAYHVNTLCKCTMKERKKRPPKQGFTGEGRFYIGLRAEKLGRMQLAWGGRVGLQRGLVHMPGHVRKRLRKKKEKPDKQVLGSPGWILNPV